MKSRKKWAKIRHHETYKKALARIEKAYYDTLKEAGDSAFDSMDKSEKWRVVVAKLPIKYVKILVDREYPGPYKLDAYTSLRETECKFALENRLVDKELKLEE